MPTRVSPSETLPNAALPPLLSFAPPTCSLRPRIQKVAYACRSLRGHAASGDARHVAREEGGHLEVVAPGSTVWLPRLSRPQTEPNAKDPAGLLPPPEHHTPHPLREGAAVVPFHRAGRPRKVRPALAPLTLPVRQPPLPLTPGGVYHGAGGMTLLALLDQGKDAVRNPPAIHTAGHPPGPAADGLSRHPRKIGKTPAKNFPIKIMLSL